MRDAIPTVPDLSVQAPLVVDAWASEELPRLRWGEGCSGSAQFSAVALAGLVARAAPRRVVVVDLRAEAHGFLNGHAVSWYAPHNQGAAPRESSRTEAGLLGALAGRVGERVALGTKGSVLAEAPAPDTLEVLTVVDERRVAEAAGASYLRLPVADHSAPEAFVVEAFLEAQARWTAEHHVHFHCRGGKGRTATFRALWERLRGNRTLSLDAWLAGQAAATGYDLRVLPEVSAWKHPLIEARWAFLKGFHARTAG